MIQNKVNPQVIVKKEFSFDMAHRLKGHDGQCRNLHGHTYKLIVYLKGIPGNDGMLVDFGVLKQVVQDRVISRFDHSLTFGESDELLGGFYDNRIEDIKVNILDNPPTAEVLIREFADLLLHSDIGELLHKLELYETPTAGVEWYVDF